MDPSILHVVSTKNSRRRKARNLTQTQKEDTGVVNDAYFSVSNFDTCALTTKVQHNHATDAIPDAAQTSRAPSTMYDTYIY